VTGLWKETTKNIKRAMSPNRAITEEASETDEDGPNTPPSSTSSFSKNSPRRYSLRSSKNLIRNKKQKQKSSAKPLKRDEPPHGAKNSSHLTHKFRHKMAIK
jgi:hypothetical protein